MPDERRHGRVGARVAEERRLELGVGALERRRRPSRSRRSPRRSRSGARAAPCGRAPAPPSAEARRARARRSRRRARAGARRARGARRRASPARCARDSMNVRTSGRYSYSAGPRALHVLLERERELVALLERAAEEDERAETEAPQGDVELRSANGHGIRLRAGRLASCLAAWAPVGGAVRVALAARADDRPAAPARPPGAPVDVSARPRRGERRLHQPAGSGERPRRASRRRRPARAPTARRGPPRAPRPSTCSRSPRRRAGAAAPRRAGGRRAAARARPRPPSSNSLREDVRPEPPPHRPPLDLEHGAVPEHCLLLAAAQDEPRPADARRAARLDAPAAGHAQVAPHDDAALEAQQEVLADRLDALEHAARRPAARRRSAAPRGCGDSTSSRSPTSTWSRCAARTSESPSGTTSR